MPLELIMASDAVMALGVASGHYNHPRPLLILRACNRANMKKGHTLILYYYIARCELW
jgi:hypothetical protein